MHSPRSSSGMRSFWSAGTTLFAVLLVVFAASSSAFGPHSIQHTLLQQRVTPMHHHRTTLLSLTRRRRGEERQSALRIHVNEANMENDMHRMTPSHSESSSKGAGRATSRGTPTRRSGVTSLFHHASIVAGSAALATFLCLPNSAAHAALVESATNLFTTTTATTNVWYASLAETGFYQAFSLVFVSELGDKTFFIAGLLAMKTTRWISAVGSIGALTVMTLISVAIGQIFHVVPAGFGDGLPIDDICAALAFLFFGLKTLKDALDMDDVAPGESSGGGMEGELKEAQETVDENQGFLNKNTLGQIASIFALVFAAEFGDRSFLSTIALSAAQKPWAVAGGAIAAHALATGVAVTGGSVVAKYLSEKVIGLIGGTLFIVFAVTTVLGIF